MTAEEGELARAELQSRRARAQLTATLVDIQSRANPRALARDAIEELRTAGSEVARAGVEAARRHPGPLLAVLATCVAIATRHRIFGALTARPGDTSVSIPTHPTLATEPPPPRLPAVGAAAIEGPDHD